jgi:hypothetical protein
VNKKEDLQLQGYCDLWGCEKAAIANVLTNNDYTLILDEIRRETFTIKADKLEGFDVPMERVLEIAKDNIFDTESYWDFISTYYSVDILNELIAKKCEDEKAQEMFNSFVEIPIEERVIEVAVERDDEELQRIYKRVEECREYLFQVFKIQHVA